jgi:hypothetical protein
MKKALIVLLSLLTLAVAQGKPKIAVYVTGAKDPGVDKALGTMMLSALVNSGRYQAVERSEEFLKQLAAEHSKQRSGAIENDQIKKLGKQFGVDFICIADVTPALGSYSVSARIMNVESAEIVAMGNTDSQMNVLAELSDASQRIVAMMFGLSAPAQQARPTQPVQEARRTESVKTTIEGTLVPGNSLTEKLAWLQRSADSHNTYILEVKANENIAPHTFEYKGGINITIVLRGDNVNRTIRLSSHGNMFVIRPNVTFVLENNITLHGHNQNTGSIIYVDGGTLKMNTGSTITGNLKSSNNGGGVYVANKGIFEMNGGTISGNAAFNEGGGVYIYGGGTFTMKGGTISGNTAHQWGGGIDVNSGTFVMRGGTITGNTATNNGGGGVSMNAYQTVTISGGTITGNTARENGGGVFVNPNGIFTKNGGIITGYSSDKSNGNVVIDEGGNVLARKGHAVFASEDIRKETTAGPEANLSYDGNKWNNKSSGAWDR